MNTHWFTGPGWYRCKSGKMEKICSFPQLPKVIDNTFPFTVNENGDVVRAMMYNGNWIPAPSVPTR